jgi:hypothetical protein
MDRIGETRSSCTRMGFITFALLKHEWCQHYTRHTRFVIPYHESARGFRRYGTRAPGVSP